MSQEILSLAMIDDALKPLLDGLALALQSCGPVVVHTLWHPLPYISLLPFHLHLRWAGCIDALPLTITCTVAPFLHADSRLVQTPLYEIDKAHMLRDRARFQRYKLQSYHTDDFKHPHWEESLRKPRHRDAFQGKLLPGNSLYVKRLV